MEEKKVKQIKNHIMQCVGALADDEDMSLVNNKHLLVAELTQISLEICKVENKYNMFVAKPLIKGLIFIFKNRLQDIQKEDISLEIKKAYIDQYKSIINTLEKMVESIKQ